MKLYRLFFFCVPLLLCAFAAGQSSVTADAPAKIQKEKHEAMVEHAKTLLEKKASLPAELAGVEKSLVKLDNGEDVNPGATLTSGSTTFYNGCGCCVTLSNITGTTTGSLTSQ